MVFFAYAALAAAASDAAAAPSMQPAVRPEVVALAQIEVKRQTIIRIRPATAPPQPVAPVKWHEKSAPSCIRSETMAAAMISGPRTIDLIVRGGTRYRARLEKSCDAVGFYSGFYVDATRDGRICEDRDAIKSRSGDACMIDKFKTLVPAK